LLILLGFTGCHVRIIIPLWSEAFHHGAVKIIVSLKGVDKLLKAYRDHLLNVGGLAARTCDSRTFYAREFLHAHLRSAQQGLNLQALKPEVLLNHILERSKHDSPARLQQMASGLRSFCRFLCLTGRSGGDLSSAIPRIGGNHRPGLPDYLLPEELKDLLDSIDTQGQVGLRNYAILLCLARLGLRAGEVARLTLDQIDWRAGVVRLSAGKGRRERELPLPKDLGRAIANYLRWCGDGNGNRCLFRAMRNGGAALSPAAVSTVSRRALQEAGIRTAHSGSHLLRRTVASHLVQQGVHLKAVADLLGHRSLNTTRIYASVNHSMLLEVARPWPVEVKR
jgi:site-specific recombinase XerD